MHYIALYRKFRPKNFDNVKGQDHIIITLKNQIVNNKISHAYLFYGASGTGKTTVAKIFAKAINCKNTINGNPCNKCEICKIINTEKTIDIIEIDGASNNGVENIRTICEEINYNPINIKYKIYIIDEVHMLSNGAFNALLKILEEPPHYIIFILATTKIGKIPNTVLSRCQCYNFKYININTIFDRLIEIINIENKNMEKKAIFHIAEKANGSMRNALSLLEKCNSFCLNKKITYKKTLKILGTIDISIFNKIFVFILKQNISKTLKYFNVLLINGIELEQFIIDFISYLHNLILIKNSCFFENINISLKDINILKKLTKILNINIIMYYIDILLKLLNKMHNSLLSKKILIEITLVKICQPIIKINLNIIINKINILEKKINNNFYIKKNEHKI